MFQPLITTGSPITFIKLKELLHGISFSYKVLVQLSVILFL